MPKPCEPCGLLDGDGGDGAVVRRLLGAVLGVLGHVALDGVRHAVVADAEDVGAGALAKTAADAILVDRSLPVAFLSLELLVPGPLTQGLNLFTRFRSGAQRYSAYGLKRAVRHGTMPLSCGLFLADEGDLRLNEELPGCVRKRSGSVIFGLLEGAC